MNNCSRPPIVTMAINTVSLSGDMSTVRNTVCTRSGVAVPRRMPLSASDYG